MTPAVILVAANAMSFNCVVDPPRSVSTQGVAANPIGLPPQMNQWAFGVSIEESKDELNVALDWPGDPIRVGKAVGALSIGPHDYSFVSLHAGPCLFTQTSCQFQYTMSLQKDGSARILVQPSALSSDGDWSTPLQAFMTGRCTPKKAAK